MAFDIGSIEATLELDRSPFISSLEAAERAARDFEGNKYEAQLGADTAGLTADVANANRIVESFDRTRATAQLDADWQGAGTVAAATQAVNAVPDRKTTSLDATNNTTAEALRATAAVNAVPDKKTTEFEARGDAAESVARRLLSMIRSIPSMVRIGFSIVNDPHEALSRISSTVRSIGRRVIPITFRTNAAETGRDLNLVQRGIMRVSSAGASMANVFGRDGSMIRRIGSAFAGLVGIAIRIGSAFAGLASIFARVGTAAANMLLMLSGSAVTVQQLGQAASGALAGMGGFGAALGAIAAQAAAAAPMLIITAVALAAVGAAVMVLAGVIGAVVAALVLLVLNLATLAGAAVAAAAGLALVGAAVFKVVTDLQKAGQETGKYGQALQQLKSELDKIGPAFDKAFQGAATEVAQIGTKVLQLARQTLPQLGQAAEQSVKAMEQGFQRAEKSTDGLKAALDALPGIMNSLTATVTNLGAAFDGFLQAALPQIQQFVQWCESASKALAEWANSEQGIQQIQAAIEAASEVAREFWDGLKQVGSALMELANNHGPAAATAVDLFFDAVSAGIGFLDAMLSAIESICSALSELIELAGAAASALQSLGIGSGGGLMGGIMDKISQAGQVMEAADAASANSAGGIGRAHGGDVHMAGGGSVGAHWVDSFTQGIFSGMPVTYGEALSGGNREYAFPMDDGGTRFITEEPGYDDDSFGLWMDLGDRKGWLNSILSGRGMPQASDLTGHRNSVSQVSNIQTSRQSSGDGSSRVEHRIDHMEKVLASVLNQVRDATQSLPHQIRESVNHNLSFGRGTRASVLRGLGRETRRFVFEGAF